MRCGPTAAKPEGGGPTGAQLAWGVPHHHQELGPEQAACAMAIPPRPQTAIDSAIVAVQEYTANPRTDAALGKVGR